MQDILIKDPVKRIEWADLFKRELTTTDIEDIKVYSLEQQEATKQIGSAEQEKQKASKSFKYILNERNKIYFLYKVLEEMIELNFNTEMPIYSYLMVKRLYTQAMFIKTNLVTTNK